VRKWETSSVVFIYCRVGRIAAAVLQSNALSASDDSGMPRAMRFIVMVSHPAEWALTQPGGSIWNPKQLRLRPHL
jgi:hypothetical protein